jgi:hypothetical protein
VRASALIAALDDATRRAWLAARGAYRPGSSAADVEAGLATLFVGDPSAILCALQHDTAALAQLFRALAPSRRWPGRAEALLACARAVGAPLPASEYQLPEDALESLVARVRRAHGRRLQVRANGRHKGRVGDAVERLLCGRTLRGSSRAADHPAAEIKSVPVAGDRVVERVKLGVVSARSDPLAKCDRVLFVFVERRGADHFVRGHSVVEFDRERWRALWEQGFLVETAAGSPRHPARGLYLTPRWFRRQRLWPPA